MWVLLRIGIFYENLSEGGVDMSYLFGVLFPKTKQAEKVFLSSLFRSIRTPTPYTTANASILL